MRRLLLGIALLWLGGCAWLSPPSPAPGDPRLSGAARGVLIADLVAALREPFPPAKTQLLLTPGPESPAALADSLAQALREAGYGVTSAPVDGAVPLRVHLHAPTQAQLWVRLDAGPVFEWTRLYARQGSALAPLSGPTVRVE